MPEVSHFYSAFRLSIHSEVPLPELVEEVYPSPPPDVVICRRRIAPNIISQVDGGRRFLGRVQGVGRFFIENGESLVVESDPGISDDRLRPTILGPIFSILLRQRGYNVLHASCTVVDGHAIAFIGDCGAGKSTIVEAFVRAGHRMLTDDVLAIDQTDDRCLVLPSYPQTKLNPDSLEVLGFDHEESEPLFAGSSKRIRTRPVLFQSEPAPLRAIFFLRKGENQQINKLSAKQGLALLLRHSRAIPPLSTPDFIRTQFEQCTSLVNRITVAELKRPSSLESLSETVRYVEEYVADTFCEFAV